MIALPQTGRIEAGLSVSASAPGSKLGSQRSDVADIEFQQQRPASCESLHCCSNSRRVDQAAAGWSGQERRSLRRAFAVAS